MSRAAGCYHLSGYPGPEDSHKCECGQAAYDECKLPQIPSNNCGSCCGGEDAAFIKDIAP